MRTRLLPGRRRLLRAGAALAAWAVAGGHTPYRQWAVYRRKHLLIGTCRADAPTYPLGKRIVAALESRLPEARARVTRARDQLRLASLITTGQLEVVLFAAEDAAGLRDGAPPFAAFGPTPLAALFRYGPRWLLCRPDFPDRHGWLVARALSESAAGFADAGPADDSVVPVHSGARAFAAGAPEPPAPPPDPEAAPEPDHSHP